MHTPSLPGMESLVDAFAFKPQPHEYKVVALRECPTPMDLALCDEPSKCADYWRLHIEQHPYFNPECECFVALILNTRRKVKGHYPVSVGIQDTILVHPREVFRLALVTSASAIVLLHNICVAAHKLCYVERPVMCSYRSAMLPFTRVPGRKEGYA